jgi:acetyl-CoA C-acetyltransferase
MGVALLGMGICGFTPTSTGLSYREMIAKAAKMAYMDAGVTLDQIDGAVSAEEDFPSGYSIADEYVPDQLGMVRKPVYTIPGDFMHAVASAAMQIETGRFDILVVESYSKASNVLTKDEMIRFAFDPVYNRFGLSPHWLAGLELNSFLSEAGYAIEEVAEVVVKNREAAIANSNAPYGDKYSVDDVLDSRPVSLPLTELMCAQYADGAVIAVLGTDEAARRYSEKPAFISGIGWGSGTSILERRDHTFSIGTAIAAERAYQESGITNPTGQIDAFFVSDSYAHRQLMHMEALGVNDNHDSIVNPNGGALGGGDMFEATGGVRLFEAFSQLRGEAGRCQIDAQRALVHAWRGIPTDSCVVAILDIERRAL